MNYLFNFIVGTFVGAASWGISPLVSGEFEPFDTMVGWVIGQALMLTFTIYTGWTKKLALLLVVVAGMYVGQNAYAYIVGPSGIREWFVLGLVTNILLCIIPFAGGGLAKCASLYVHRPKK